MNLYIDSE